MIVDKRLGAVVAAVSVVGAASACSSHRTAALPPKLATVSSASHEVASASAPSESVTPSDSVAASSARSTVSPTPSPTSGASTPAAAIDWVRETVPVLYCDTAAAWTPGPSRPASPTTAEALVPSTLTAQLAFFRDYRNLVTILAPKTWHCSAAIFGNTSAFVVAAPADQKLPGGAALLAGATPPVEGIRANEAVGMSDQFALDCAYLPNVGPSADGASAFASPSCPPPPPSARVTYLDAKGHVTSRSQATIAAYEEPAGTAPGTRIGRVVYDGASYAYTCTLPDTDRAVCLAATDWLAGLSSTSPQPVQGGRAGLASTGP